MADLFSTNRLTAIVPSLWTPPQFLLSTFFPGLQTETSEEIHFDVDSDVRGLAPFVSPVVEGQIMTNRGFTTKTFKPAYVKPKNIWDPNKALKRWKGEQIGGSLSPEERRIAQVNEILRDQKTLILRRMEWMAAQALIGGSITVSGDKYPTQVVSFGRDNTLTVTKDAAAEWGDAGINPLTDLQTWAETVYNLSGSYPRTVVMDSKAWALFKEDDNVKSRLTLQRALGQMPTMQQDAAGPEGGNYKGSIDNFDIWVYVGSYKDDAGTVTKYLADYTVLMVGDIMGYKAYGAIMDEAAGLQALEMFSKSWVEEDPPLRFIMTQSAPLVVPYRPNASMAITVKS